MNITSIYKNNTHYYAQCISIMFISGDWGSQSSNGILLSLNHFSVAFDAWYNVLKINLFDAVLLNSFSQPFNDSFFSENFAVFS